MASHAGRNAPAPLNFTDAMLASASRPFVPSQRLPHQYTTRVYEWCMGNVKSVSAAWASPQFFAGIMPLCTTLTTALLALAALLGWVDLQSDRDIRALGIISFILNFGAILVSVIVDSLGDIVPGVTSQALTHESAAIVSMPHVALCVLSVVQLVRMLLVAHDVDDIGANVLFHSADTNFKKFVVFNRVAGALWGYLYTWIVIASYAIHAATTRAYTTYVSSVVEINEQVDKRMVDKLNKGARIVSAEIRAATPAALPMLKVLALNCIRTVRPAMNAVLSTTTLFTANTAGLVCISVIIMIHGVSALLISTDVIEFDDQQDLYNFYFYPSMLVILISTGVLALEIVPHADKYRTKFTRDYIIATSVPVIVAVVFAALTAFRLNGLHAAIGGAMDDDADDDGDTLFMTNNFFFDNQDVNHAKLIFHDGLYACVDLVMYQSILVWTYVMCALMAHLRPTIVDVFITFDPREAMGSLSLGKAWTPLSHSDRPNETKAEEVSNLINPLLEHNGVKWN